MEIPVAQTSLTFSMIMVKVMVQLFSPFATILTVKSYISALAKIVSNNYFNSSDNNVQNIYHHA